MVVVQAVDDVGMEELPLTSKMEIYLQLGFIVMVKEHLHTHFIIRME